MGQQDAVVGAGERGPDVRPSPGDRIRNHQRLAPIRRVGIPIVRGNAHDANDPLPELKIRGRRHERGRPTGQADGADHGDACGLGPLDELLRGQEIELMVAQIQDDRPVLTQASEHGPVGGALGLSGHRVGVLEDIPVDQKNVFGARVVRDEAIDLGDETRVVLVGRVGIREVDHDAIGFPGLPRLRGARPCPARQQADRDGHGHAGDESTHPVPPGVSSDGMPRDPVGFEHTDPPGLEHALDSARRRPDCRSWRRAVPQRDEN